MDRTKKNKIRPEATGFGKLFRDSGVVLLTGLLTLIILEVGTQIYVQHFADDEQFLKYASVRDLEKRFGSQRRSTERYTPYRYLGYIPTPNYFRSGNKHNSLGYRGEEIRIPKSAGEFRIVCVGGSTTYETGIKDYHKTYPYLLEKKLRDKGFTNVTVVNAGVGSWTSWESLINFQLRILDLEPDMIIVLDGLNDIHARFVWPPSAYRGDNSGSRTLEASRPFMPSILEYSALMRIFLVRSGTILSHSALETRIDKRSPTYYLNRFMAQKLQGKYPEGIFKEASAMEMLKTNKPVYFRRNLENLIAAAREHGVQVVLATFASSPLFKDSPQASSEEYLYASEEMRGIVRDIARKKEVPLLDLAVKFPTDKKYYTFDGLHVNKKGADLKAQMFADFIANDHLIPPAAPANS